MEFSKGKDLYAVLGCDELSDKEQVCTEFRRRIIKVHPDKKPNDKEAEKKYEELKEAYDILSNDEKRKKYDTWRRSGLAVPFHVWVTLKSCQSGQHWALRPKKEKMLLAASHVTDDSALSSDHDDSHVSVITWDGREQPCKGPPLFRKRSASSLSQFRFEASGTGSARSKFRRYKL